MHFIVCLHIGEFPKCPDESLPYSKEYNRECSDGYLFIITTPSYQWDKYSPYLTLTEEDKVWKTLVLKFRCILEKQKNHAIKSEPYLLTFWGFCRNFLLSENYLTALKVPRTHIGTYMYWTNTGPDADKRKRGKGIEMSNFYLVGIEYLFCWMTTVYVDGCRWLQSHVNILNASVVDTWNDGDDKFGMCILPQFKYRRDIYCRIKSSRRTNPSGNMCATQFFPVSTHTCQC